MKSYTTGRALYGTFTKNTASANLTLGDQLANDDYRAICAMRDWPWLERLRTISTVASTQFYNLPHDCDQVREVAVTVSSKRYVPAKSPDRAHWDMLNGSVVTADIPQWWFITAGQIGLWPTPATSSNTITILQKTRVIDLSVADYTTGTIVSVANGGTAVVGSSTVWTAQMAGRFIRITHLDTANTGDGEWYEVSSVTDATHLTLVRAYGGTAISAGSAAYTIGQMPLLPEAFHDLPWLHAAGVYWQKEADPRGAAFLAQHGLVGAGSTVPTGRVAVLAGSATASDTDHVIDDGLGRGRDSANPNDYVTY